MSLENRCEHTCVSVEVTKPSRDRSVVLLDVVDVEVAKGLSLPGAVCADLWQVDKRDVSSNL